MFTVLLVLQVLMGISIIGLVLLQQGKGADMGAAFGAGASGTVFGAAGGGSFFTRVTAVLAALFFANSVLLSSPLVREVPDTTASVTESVPVTEESDVPAVEDEPVAEQTDLPPADVPSVPAEPSTEPSQTAEPGAAAPAETPEAPAGEEPAKPQ
jgi:preprotein translocase subunit SecG